MIACVCQKVAETKMQKMLIKLKSFKVKNDALQAQVEELHAHLEAANATNLEVRYNNIVYKFLTLEIIHFEIILSKHS